MEKLLQVLNRIERPDINSMRKMRIRLNNLTKPLGSLGQLEDIAVQFAGIQATASPQADQKAIIIMCGDHGVTEERVSAYPSEVTGAMMANFVKGGAAINVLARQSGAVVRVVDIGSYLAEVPDGIMMQKIRRGTGNIAKGPAMAKKESVEAIVVGVELALSLADEGMKVIGLGEMGIGNTTPSSAMTAVLTGKLIQELTGRGTGIPDADLAAKMEVIERAIRVNQPDPADVIDVIAKVGGLEIAGLVGVILGAASRRVAVVIDGVITGAAALAAYRIEPRCSKYMIASHLSAEPAHRIILESLGLKPILHLGMRLGEGSGAALVFPVLESAIRIVEEMATFDDIGLSSPAPELEEFSLRS